MAEKQGPLAGFRVLDLSRVLAGPWCTQLLADYGAEVWKIERPGVGDDTRGWGPPYILDANGNATRESAYFAAANRGKSSIELDFSGAEGQATIRALALKADILVENYKVGGLAKFGLDAPSLLALNPRLIYCSITGFGQTGPYAARPGYDVMIQGMGGLMSLTGEADGAPQKVGVAIADLMTGMYAATAILAAVAERQRSGLGQHIDLALFDVQLAMLANQATNYLIGGTEPKRFGNAHPNVVPYQVFATADGYVIVAVGNDGQFANYAEAVGAPGLAADPRFITNSGRIENRAALMDVLEPAMCAKPTAYWIASLEAAGVPCGPVNTLSQAFAEPQAVAREAVVAVPHAGTAEVKLAGNPVRFSRTPIERKPRLPTLGDGNDLLSSIAEDGSAAEHPQGRRLS